MILYEPGSYLDDLIKRYQVAGLPIVAEENGEPQSGATTALIRPTSLSCGGRRLALGNSTLCSVRNGTIDIS